MELHNSYTSSSSSRGINTGAVIGKEGNSTFKIDTYVGKDIQNYDTMTTTGGSIGVSLGEKPKITKVTPDTYKNYLEIIKRAI